MHGLKPRWISARETGFYLVDLKPRTGRIRVAMDDPNQVGLVQKGVEEAVGFGIGPRAPRILEAKRYSGRRRS